MVRPIEFLHLGEKALVAAAAAKVAKKQRAVEATVDKVPVLLTGGSAVEIWLVGLRPELRAIHDVLLLDTDAIGDGAVGGL